METPGMEFGKDLTTGRERVITPWKSADDPSRGEYLHWLDTNGYPQIFVRQGSVVRWRYGPWNGLKFQGRSIENPSPIYLVQFVFNEKEIYFKYEVKTSVVQRVLVLPDDTTVHLRWMDQTQDWAVHDIRTATDSCSGYGLCSDFHIVPCFQTFLSSQCYLSNSLLLDETRNSMLDWPQRFNIIQGMARGILYLHQDSRLQIIHRHLKAGNILLDGNMNPKISGFGLARNFVGSDTATKTKKVVGTHGYISPEYAIHGRFSIKSDVYSFGVLVLEIVSGKKNREFSHDDYNDNLLGHVRYTR
ncbi:putative protein kinase RLK-Pelle-DLSV family [Helianthus annuus]|nr:putative protein kinase RLK-Pelle-DLSV family [Helianthus annuus]KAJ0900242.1 putative protein kinase RLK-Pelle-DLSV family [Helianthus annuus]